MLKLVLFAKGTTHNSTTFIDQGRPGFLGIQYTGALIIGYTVYCSLNTGIRYITFFEFQV